jgi:hypothetical protein
MGQDDMEIALARIAWADIRRIWRAGRLIPPDEWPADIALAVRGYTETETTRGSVENPTVEVERKVQFEPRVQAIKLLTALRGMGRDRKQAPLAIFEFIVPGRDRQTVEISTPRGRAGRKKGAKAVQSVEIPTVSVSVTMGEAADEPKGRIVEGQSVEIPTPTPARQGQKRFMPSRDAP